MTQTALELRAALCLDLGGTQLRTALVRPDGSVAHRRTRPTPGDAAELVATIVAALSETEQAARAAGDDPVAIGISAPGPLDPFAGAFIDPPNLARSTWGLPLAQRIADGVGLRATMDKDTNVAALGEGFFGAAVGTANFVYVTISTGVGAAIVTGGRLLHGPDGVAGELGHLAIDAYDGPLCGCGARGHLEAIASGSGIAGQAVAAGLKVRPGSAADVAALEAAGDPTAARLMQRAREAVSSALVTIVDVFNPDLVIVGGGIAAAEGERMLGPARESVGRMAFKVQARRARIVAPKLGDDVSLVGGLILANAAARGIEAGPALDAYGLAPRACDPGHRALPIKPVNSDHTVTHNETKRAVGIG